MSSQDRLPVEVWLKICDDIPKDVVPALSSTSHLFRSMLSPLLFAHFDFHTWTPIGSPVVDGAKLDRYLERLDFFSSDKIAPLVRSCDITPRPPVRLPAQAVLTFSESLLARFYERLPRLTNTQRFYAEGCDLTQAVMTILCRLPALEHLDVNSCPFVAGAHSPSLLHMKHLSVAWMDEGETLAFLSKFPRVKSLALVGTTPPAGWVATQAFFPLLREFKCSGQYDTLSAFLSLPTLTCVTVDNYHPQLLMTHLAGNRTSLSKITLLTISFTSWYHFTEREMNIPFLNTLYEFFPTLTELRISIDHGSMNSDFNSVATVFFKALPDAPALPPTLKHLCLSWEFDPEFGVPPTDTLPDFTALRDALVARCPALVALWLDGEDFLFRWRKYSDGTAVEAMLDNCDDAEQMRDEEWPTFWGHSNCLHDRSWI
ncbi:hypothetical protein FB451DRAFT_1372087 [Mycena latifolia]|nr:hypothetical protein FB451DRAFT_1372087 [Mycena latifolia]